MIWKRALLFVVVSCGLWACAVVGDTVCVQSLDNLNASFCCVFVVVVHFYFFFLMYLQNGIEEKKRGGITIPQSCPNTAVFMAGSVL